jgi:hypothetical protein
VAGAQFLPGPEDQEQAVVGAGADGQDEHQVLGQRRHRHSGLARLADHRPGEPGDQHGGSEGQQRCQQRAEHHEQQGHDEHDGQVQAQADRCLVGLAGISLGGHRAGQVGAQVAGQRAGRDGRAQARDQVLFGAGGSEVEAVGQHLQLHRLTVGAVAEVLDLLHVGDLGQAGSQPPDGGDVRGGDRAAAAGDDDQDRCLVRVLERGGQPGGGHARAAGRQLVGVVHRDDAGQRRKKQAGQDGRGHPRGDDGPAEPDREPPGGGEERVHHGEISSVPSLITSTRIGG